MSPVIFLDAVLYCELCGRARKTVRIREKYGNIMCCDYCYRTELAPKEECDICGNLKYVYARNRDTGEVFCERCWKESKYGSWVCQECGKNRAGRFSSVLGKFICNTCYYRHLAVKKICVVCRGEKSVREYVEEGPLCSACSKRRRRRSRKS